MKLIFISVLVLILCVFVFEAKDLIVGSRANYVLIKTEKVVYKGIPLVIREQDYTYTDPKQRIIRAIIARDLSRTQTKAVVTSGGLGKTDFTIHFTSGRGEAINYLVQIFSESR